MWRIAVLAIVTLTITIPVQAKQEKTNKHETSQYVVEKQVAVERRGAFSPAERNLIRAQLLGQKRTTSQRNHKKLPPGLQKKIARGKALPPGWQKKWPQDKGSITMSIVRGRACPMSFCDDCLLHRPAPKSYGLKKRSFVSMQRLAPFSTSLT